MTVDERPARSAEAGRITLILDGADVELLPLLHAAFVPRRAHFGRQVKVHILNNVQSGLCPEDCSYCSQSRDSTAPIDEYPLARDDDILARAGDAAAAGASRYCIVLSGRGPSPERTRHLAGLIRQIKQRFPIEVCLSVGLLDESDARVLAEAGLDRLNHNLNTSERFYPEICSTHSYEDRMETLTAASGAGLDLCSGSLFGMGESHDDIIDLFLELRGLEVRSIPVNFLHPIEGTPLEGVSYLTPHDCLRILCLARFLNPQREIRVAGGRELHLRSLQGLSLYPANSIFVDGYLTTPGQPAEAAWQMIRDMGFEIEQHVPASSDAGPAAAQPAAR